MPTSSIFTPVKLETKEEVERFLEAWDKAEANIGKFNGNNVHILTPKEVREKFIKQGFFEKVIKENEAINKDKVNDDE